MYYCWKQYITQKFHNNANHIKLVAKAIYKDLKYEKLKIQYETNVWNFTEENFNIMITNQTKTKDIYDYKVPMLSQKNQT